MAVQQFASVSAELLFLGYKGCKTPLYIVYDDRGETNKQLMFFQNQVDVCLLFYKGKPNKEHLVNFDAALREKLGNVKVYTATEKAEVFIFGLSY
jgi:hypothetical protein